MKFLIFRLYYKNILVKITALLKMMKELKKLLYLKAVLIFSKDLKII